jgi:hypothetical protein
MAQPTDDELVEHIVDHLSEEQAETLAGLSDAEIGRRVRLGLARSRSHGFVEPEPAAAFVTLMFLVSPRFDSQPEIAAALAAGQGSGEQRLRSLFAKTAEQDWDAAVAMGGWETLA